MCGTEQKKNQRKMKSPQWGNFDVVFLHAETCNYEKLWIFTKPSLGG